MESRDYETILNAMPETSVFVIRESDCGLLYVNRRAEEASSEVCLGASCCELWTHVCGRCPLLRMADRQESRFVSYNEPFGGMVNIVVTRTLWEEAPAFVITVAPRAEAGCRAYREILRADLFRDCCELLKSIPDSWRMDGDCLTEQLERFARSGAVYPPDVQAFVDFVQPDRLRAALRRSQEPQSLLYRRGAEGGWRWNQLEVIPEQEGSDQSVLLCVREIYSAPPALLEPSHMERDMQMAAILRARFKTMNTVELDSGRCRVADLSRRGEAEHLPELDYAAYISNAVANSVHPEDVEMFQAALSLEHLREKAQTLAGGCQEEVCVYRRKDDPAHWMELRVIYSRQGAEVAVNILGQDVTSEKRREISQERAMEDWSYIISSLSSLFFSTYYIDLDQDAFRTVTQLRRVKDVLGSEVNYTAALEIYANHFVHPDDREEYLTVMGIQNLRQSLRWWKPYVAVEYRKLSEEEEAGSESWGWVRATAVLARAKEDDMPDTAVYVAQDITEGKRGV